MSYTPFEELVGKTISRITGAEKDSEEISFDTTDGYRYTLYHENDCCESVEVNDVEGDIEDLIDRPIVLAEESTRDKDEDIKNGMENLDSDESYTWTFYRIATAKGFVVIRWFGQSNGYYSESVSFRREKNPDWVDPVAIWAN